MKYYFFMILVSLTIACYSQQSDSIIEKYYYSKKIAARLGLSYQQNVFAEIGVSFHNYKVIFPKKQKYSHFGFSMYGAYLSSEFLLRNDKTILGPKIGFESVELGPTYGAALAFETILYTDLNKKTLTFTPKYGLPLGAFELYYGYNIFTNNDLSKYIGRHRFSISLNINKTYWKKQNQMLKALHP